MLSRSSSARLKLDESLVLQRLHYEVFSRNVLSILEVSQGKEEERNRLNKGVRMEDHLDMVGTYHYLRTVPRCTPEESELEIEAQETVNSNETF